MKHDFELETKNDLNRNKVTITVWCKTCRSKAQIQVDDIDYVLDAQVIKHRVYELQDAHIYAREPAVV